MVRVESTEKGSKARSSDFPLRCASELRGQWRCGAGATATRWERWSGRAGKTLEVLAEPRGMNLTSALCVPHVMADGCFSIQHSKLHNQLMDGTGADSPFCRTLCSKSDIEQRGGLIHVVS